MGITLFYSLLFSCIMLKVFILLAIVACALVAISEAKPFQWNKGMEDMYCQKMKGRHSGTNYTGVMRKTKSGKVCQKWTSQKPHRHSRTPQNKRFKGKGLGNHNLCRNPDGEKGGVWCYTMSKGKRWEYCPVPKCGKHLHG